MICYEYGSFVLRLRLTVIFFNHKSLYYFIHVSIVALGMTMCIHPFLETVWVAMKFCNGHPFVIIL